MLRRKRRPNPTLRSRASAAPARHLFLGLVLVVLLAVFFTAGCGNKSLSSSERRAVTGEIIAAAERVTPPAALKPDIIVRPEIRGWWRLPWPVKTTTDNIYVTLASDSEAAALGLELAGIARRHHLELGEPSAPAENARRFDLTYRGERTHSVRVVAPGAGRGPAARGGGRARLPPGSAGAPRLAIIIDDMGHDRAAADSLLALPFPLTISVLPHLPLSAEIADEAYRKNDQVMLHLPMQSEGESMPSEGTKPEPVELRVGMNSGQVEELVNGMLSTVPHALGANNHQGSRATADLALMRAVMADLHARRLFFIDSRTTAATVAYDTAHAAGVRAASRKVFLDDAPTRQAVLAQLDLAARDAARDGSAIAIGHPHPATLAVLAEEVPRLKARGVRIVFASELTE